MFQTSDICSKTGESVIEVIQLRKPYAQAPKSNRLDIYQGPPPEQFQLDITVETVAVVARRLLGGADLVETDSVSLQH